MKLSMITGAVIAAGVVLPMAGLTAPAAHAGPVRASSTPVAPAAPAGAWGHDCDSGCSEIQNRSNESVRVAKDWCGNESNGTIVAEYQRLGPWACSANLFQQLYPGEHSYSAAWHDTDAFRVYGGCSMAVQWNFDGFENGPITYYNPGAGTNIWVKVAGNYDIDIERYVC